MGIKRAGCYERVSTDEQALHGFSIETQIANLEEYCNDKMIKIVNHYTDEGISGTNPPLKRPALQQLLEDVEAGKIDVVLFTKLDRWFRSVKEYFKVQEILDKHKVEWKAIHEDYDTSTANGKMAITIFLAIAQNESDRASERIKVVFDHKRKNREAYFGGHSIPLGYVKEIDEDGVPRLVKDPETRDAMQDFWDIYVSTNNINKAIRHVNNAYGLMRERRSWTRISKSDFYCGIHRGIEDFCEPYVEPEDFLRLQEQRPIKHAPSGRVYLLRSLLRCQECGCKLSGDASIQYGKPYKSYRCSRRGVGCNNFKTFSERKLVKQLLDGLEGFIHDEMEIVELEKAKPRKKPKVDVKKLKEQKRRLNVVYMAPDSEMSDEEYNTQNNELTKLIEQAEAAAPPEPKDVSHLNDVLKTDFRGIYDTLDENEQQIFWQKLIKEIVMEDRTITRVEFF